MGDEERGEQPQIDPEVRAILQTPEGRVTTLGVWAKKFAEATYGLNGIKMDQELGPRVDRTKELIDRDVSRVVENVFRRRYSGLERIDREQKIRGTEFGLFREVGTVDSEETIGSLAKYDTNGDKARAESLLMGAKATGKAEQRYPSLLNQGISKRDFRDFCLEYGALVTLAVDAKSRLNTEQYKITGRSGGSDSTATAMDVLLARSLEQSNGLDIGAKAATEEDKALAEADAKYRASLLALRNRVRAIAMRVVAPKGIVMDGSEESKALQSRVEAIESTFMQIDTFRTGWDDTEKLAIDSHSPAGVAFREKLIKTGALASLDTRIYAEQASTGQVSETGDKTGQTEETAKLTPDQQLLEELAGMEGALVGRRSEAGKTIEQLKDQLARWEAYKGHLDGATERITAHKERLSAAGQIAEEAAKVRVLIGEDNEVGSFVSGRAVLELGAGAGRELLTGMQTEQLLAVVRDPEQFTKALVDLYKIPDDQVGMLRQAVADAATFIRPSLDMPASGRKELVELVQGKLSWVADVIGAERLEKGRLEMKRLLSSKGVEITDEDRQQIQDDVSSVKGLLGQAG